MLDQGRLYRRSTSDTDKLVDHANAMFGVMPRVVAKGRSLSTILQEPEVQRTLLLQARRPDPHTISASSEFGGADIL
jgi:hypothetical protein